MKKPWQLYGYPKPKSEASTGPLSLVDNEIYSGICLPKLPVFVRLDGWRFHSLLKKLKLKEPYDKFFAQCLVKTSERFFIPFNAKFAYIFSDEINLLFYTTSFQRVEKIDSIFAGLASVTFYEKFRQKYKNTQPIVFDCRCIPVRKKEIPKYLLWRQAEAFRNHNNSWAYHLMRERGDSPRAATRKLEGLKTKELYRLCKGYGVDLNKTPKWQRHGILLYREPYQKEGWDPIKKKKVLVKRYRIKTEWDLPRFDSMEGKKILKKLL